MRNLSWLHFSWNICISTILPAKLRSSMNRSMSYLRDSTLWVIASKQEHFKHTFSDAFWSSFKQSTSISDWIVCDLLEIVCDELPDRINIDHLRDHVYWYVAGRLDQLQHFPRFSTVLSSRPCLGKDLCLRAGNGTSTQPHKPSDPLPQRFKVEDAAGATIL